MKFALVNNGIVAETFEDIIYIGDVEFTLDQRFAPDFVASLVQVHGNVEPGWVKGDDGSFSAPAPIDSSLVIPQTVTKRQAVLALYDAGKLDALNAAIGAAGPRAKLEWETVSVVDRNSSLVQQLAPALGLDLDTLFLAAAAIPD